MWRHLELINSYDITVLHRIGCHKQKPVVVQAYFREPGVFLFIYCGGWEKYVWSFLGMFTPMYEVQIWLICSKLSTWHPAYQFVYFLFMMAFYNTHSALGFILHRRGPHECKSTKKTACCWILIIADYVHSRDNSFQRVPSDWMHFLSWQCGHKLHRTVSLSWINVLSCIPCTSLVWRSQTRARSARVWSNAYTWPVPAANILQLQSDRRTSRECNKNIWFITS